MSEGLKIKGTIKKILDVETGVSKKTDKSWKKTSFILDTKDKYNPYVCFSVFGEEKVDNFIKFNKEGQEVEVSFNVHSREHEGRWYNSIDAWLIMKSGEGEPQMAEATAEDSDSLPF